MEGESKAELKKVCGMLVIVLPLFALMFWGFLHSPLYQSARDVERESARLNIANNYHTMDADLKQELMIRYKLTEDDVNIIRIIKDTLDDEKL